MYECKYIQPIWTALKKWFNYFFKIKEHFTPHVIICNDFQGKSKDLINTCILITKQYIYVKKCLQQGLNF